MDRPALLAELAERIIALPDDAPRLVGVDGVDGVGKTVFADGLAAALRARKVPTVRVGMDGFHRPRAERYRRGRHSPEGYFRDAFDYPCFRAAVVTPLRSGGGGGTIRTARFDHREDRAVEGDVVVVGGGEVVVVDGVFLHRPELVAIWDFSVFLRAPWSVALGRMAARDGFVPNRDSVLLRRYRDGQRLYLALCRPERRASVVVDNERLEAPRIIGGTVAGDAT